MKAAFVSYDYAHDISGVSSWIIRLLPRLRECGIDVEAHLFLIGGGYGATAKGLQEAGVKVLTAPWPDHTEAGTRQCLRFFEASHPDVYVPNCFVPAFHAIRYLNLTAIPSVGVLHTDDITSNAIVEEFISGPGIQRLSAIVTVSKRLEKLARDAAPPDVLVKRIACGVPIPRQKAIRSEHKFRLVYAGRLTEEAKLISAVAGALIKAAEIWPDVEAWIVGDGPERDKVANLVNRSHARDRVFLLGRRAPSEVQALMAQCHAFVLLSEYEGLPVSMLEAMAVGLVPIVHKDSGGVAEVVENGHNGIIVLDRDHDFLKAVERLRTNRADWDRMATAARLEVQRNFGIEEGVDHWVEVLTNLASRPSSKETFVMPEAIRLPKPNPKFGWFDSRPPSLSSRIITKGRMTAGKYRGKLMRFLSGE